MISLRKIKARRLVRRIKVMLASLIEPSYVREPNRQLRRAHIAYNKMNATNVEYHEFVKGLTIEQFNEILK